MEPETITSNEGKYENPRSHGGNSTIEAKGKWDAGYKGSKQKRGKGRSYLKRRAEQAEEMAEEVDKEEFNIESIQLKTGNSVLDNLFKKENSTNMCSNNKKFDAELENAIDKEKAKGSEIYEEQYAKTVGELFDKLFTQTEQWITEIPSENTTSKDEPVMREGNMALGHKGDIEKRDVVSEEIQAWNMEWSNVFSQIK